MRKIHRIKKKRWLWALPLVLALAVVGAFLWKNRVRRVIEQGPPEARLYVVRMPTEKEVQANYTGAKYEPRYGCYLGAYVDLDPGVKQTYKDQSGRVRRLPGDFEKQIGKKHALYFFYLGYRRDLPVDWVRKLAKEDYFVQIALEPNEGLGAVQDDAYLRKLAADIAKTEAKVFLRFASEMNGPWVRYHGDPKLYIEKWRLVTKVMREDAPNVAMLWCPYVTPRRYIDEYYPGDEWVDWVGANMYNVTYYNRDRRFPGLEDHPVDLLKPVYDAYASRKPMMICEYAAARYSAFEKQDVVPFAVENIQAFYASLPTLFPRVKGVTYFSGNNMQLKHRMNNDYTVVGQPDVHKAYADAIAPAYFLSSERPDVVHAPMPLKSGDSIDPDARLQLFARTPERYALIKPSIDGTPQKAFDFPKTLFFRPTLCPGQHTIGVEVFDRQGNMVTTANVPIKVNPRPEPDNL